MLRFRHRSNYSCLLHGRPALSIRFGKSTPLGSIRIVIGVTRTASTLRQAFNWLVVTERCMLLRLPPP